MTTLAPAPVMEPGLSAVHATDRVETPVETPAVSDEERDASVRMPAEEDTHASDDKLGEKSGKKQSQRQRLSEACIESLSAMHGGKPEAVGFYKDDIIAAVKAKHGYTDKPEIYQIVLGDAKVFAREVGTRKQGVKQGRPRTLYSLVSLKGPPRPSSPSPTRQNIKDASPEAAVDVEAKKEPADEPAAPAPTPAVAAAADADALGKQRFHSKGVQKPDPRRLHPPNKHDNTQHRTGARRSLPPWRRCRRPTTVPYSQRAPSLRHSPPRVYDVFDLFEFGSHGADMTQQAEIEGSPEDLGWLNPFGSNLAEAHHHHHYQQQQQLEFQLGDDAMHFRSAQWPLSPASDEGVA